jgi:hypothetical protein
MANTLNGLFPDLYAAIDIVSREMTGYIAAVSRDSSAERASKGQTVKVPVTTSESSTTISPGPTVPDEGDTTVNNRQITIDNAESVPIRFTGEEIRGLQTEDTGPTADDPYENIRQSRFAQAYRDLVQQVENSCASEVLKSSRAYESDNSPTFSTKDDLNAFAGAARELDENGAPNTDRQFVLKSASMFQMRGTQTGILQRANEAGTEAALREGEFGDIHGMTLRHTQFAPSHTGGSQDLSTNGSATEDDTAISVTDGGGGTSLSEGDIVSFASHDDKYVVDSSLSVSGSNGTLDIKEPGLTQDVSDNENISLHGDYTPDAAFHENAIQLATRMPAVPPEGDKAEDRAMVEDPMTGLTFEVAVYPGYRQIHYEIGLAWGADITKEEHSVVVVD